MPGHLVSAEIVDFVPPARHRVSLNVEGRDLTDAETAAAAFLTALGVDLSFEERRDTPGRMARAYAALLSPREFDLTMFANDENYDQLVLVQDIRFASVCEHHALPFIGVAQVGYVPGRRIVGISKLARVVELFACRPQTQERMTQQIASWLADHLDPRGVGVAVRAEHLCMSLRGAQAQGAFTVTSALRGLLAEDATARAEFFARTQSTR